MSVPAHRAAAGTAFAAAGVNLAAALVMLLVLRDGVPAGGSTLDERFAYVRAHIGAWRAGWLLWNAAAISLLAFYVALSRRWRERAPLRCGLAPLLAAAGLAADLSAEALLIGVSPRVERADFAVIEMGAIVLTGFLGNGLYSLAGILLTSAGWSQLPRPVGALAVPLWAAGLWLSAATVAGSTDGQFWSTAILMPLFVVWAALVGTWLRARTS